VARGAQGTRKHGYAAAARSLALRIAAKRRGVTRPGWTWPGRCWTPPGDRACSGRMGALRGSNGHARRGRARVRSLDRQESTHCGRSRRSRRRGSMAESGMAGFGNNLGKLPSVQLLMSGTNRPIPEGSGARSNRCSRLETVRAVPTPREMTALHSTTPSTDGSKSWP
jgi:hypothetical protein